VECDLEAPAGVAFVAGILALQILAQVLPSELTREKHRILNVVAYNGADPNGKIGVPK